MSGASAWTLDGGFWRKGAEIAIADRGFRYGMSVFETIAWRRGKWIFLAEHLQRLRQACAAAGFAFPDGLHEASLVRSIRPGSADGLARIYITAGECPGTEGAYLYYEAAKFPEKGELARGYRVLISRAPMPCPLGGWKTGNYWAHIQAMAEASENGCDEALVFNAQEALLSGAMANVFVVTQGTLRTPALTLGARDGVVRAWVQAQRPAEESLLSMEDLMGAEECFLTNSRLGVMPVAEIDGRALPGRAVGQALSIRYREEILRD